jgi:hypothetical protein
MVEVRVRIAARLKAKVRRVDFMHASVGWSLPLVKWTGALSSMTLKPIEVSL